MLKSRTCRNFSIRPWERFRGVPAAGRTASCLAVSSATKVSVAFKESALLPEFFLACFEHLVVRGFLIPVRHQLFAQILFVFPARRAMAGG